MLFGNDYKLKVTALEKEKKQLLSRVQELEDKCLDYEKTIEAFPHTKVNHDEKLSKQQKEFETKIQGLQQKLKETETSVNKRVSMELARIGVNQFALEGTIADAVPANDDEIYKKFLSLQGSSEQATYFKKYELQISRAMSKLKKT